MRHGHGLRKLNRTSSHRLAMLQNMMNSLIEHEVIKTTVPKAKELRRVIEPMITLAKEDSVANRRLAFNRLRDRDSVTKLFNDLGPRFKARPGGYTRILKMGFRVGDNAPMAFVELVDRAVHGGASAFEGAGGLPSRTAGEEDQDRGAPELRHAALVSATRAPRDGSEGALFFLAPRKGTSR